MILLLIIKFALWRIVTPLITVERLMHQLCEKWQMELKLRKPVSLIIIRKPRPLDFSYAAGNHKILIIPEYKYLAVAISPYFKALKPNGYL